MSFGFSVGDFLAAASLISNIVSCLQTSGGSASEYQEILNELHGLRLVLSKIKHLENGVCFTQFAVVSGRLNVVKCLRLTNQTVGFPTAEVDICLVQEGIFSRHLFCHIKM
jgi:hypothetical protein